MSGYDEMLPGLAPARPGEREPGPVESAVRREIAAKVQREIIDDNFSGWCALAIQAAHDIDQSAGIGRPSGRAKLYEVMNQILENLPQPETVQTSELDAALAAIMNEPPQS